MEPNDEEIPVSVHLGRIARELKTIRELVGKVVYYIGEAEAEVPEKVRRFANYMHDVHDIKFMHEEHGADVPEFILSEIRRLDDRYRQILQGLNVGGGAFEKIRREMAGDRENRYEHTKYLTLLKEKQDEARKSLERQNGRDQSGTEPEGSQP